MPAATQGDEGFVVSWAARDTSGVASYDVQVSVDGGAWATWLRATARDVRRLAGRRRPRLRVPRPGDRPQGQRGLVERRRDLGCLAIAGDRRIRARASTTACRTAAAPTPNAAKLGTLKAGTIVAITRGPVSSDGFAWYEVTEPIREWSPVSFVERGVWIAARSSSDTMVKPYRAPNSTTVDAGLRDLDFGSGPGLGARARVPPRWRSARSRRTATGPRTPSGCAGRNAVALDSLTLNVYRTNGALVGSRSVPDRGAGAQTWDWNGRTGQRHRQERALRPAAGRARRGPDVPRAVQRGRRRSPRSPRSASPSTRWPRRSGPPRRRRP